MYSIPDMNTFISNTKHDRVMYTVHADRYKYAYKIYVQKQHVMLDTCQLQYLKFNTTFSITDL